MKFIIKNLKQVTYEVEVDNDSDTVLTLKKKIEERHNFNHDSIKLVFNQKILDNDKSLKDYNLQDGNVIIMMTSTVKARPKEPEGEKKPELKSEETAKKEESNPQPSQSKPQPQQPQQRNYDDAINQLVDMGFSRDMAKTCITASKGNLSLAVEFLENGIPENLPEDIPTDSEMLSGGMEAGSPQDQINMLIKSIASVAKVVSQNDESQLENMLGMIEQADPNLYSLISQNQDQFRKYLTEPISDEDLRIFQEFTQRGSLGLGGQGGQPGGQSGPRQAAGGKIAVTREEMEAINRLKAFGFSDMEAAQAYFACDKKEEMALNFLFDSKAREGGEDIDIDYSQFADVNPNNQGNQGGNSNNEADKKKEDENK